MADGLLLQEEEAVACEEECLQHHVLQMQCFQALLCGPAACMASLGTNETKASICCTLRERAFDLLLTGSLLRCSLFPSVAVLRSTEPGVKTCKSACIYQLCDGNCSA